MELTSYAVYNVCCYTSACSDWWNRDHPWNNGNWRINKYHRIRITDHWFSDDGNLRIRNDHDRRSIYRPYYRSLEEVPEMQDKADAVTEVKDGEIIFDHVNFSYAGEGGNLSLKDVDLHIRSGQTIGIIGGTGSAKSTLVQLIPRLYDVTEGCVKVGGIDVRDYNLEALRDQVSMVLQKNVLFTGTIYDNIRWGDENASDEEVQRMCKLAQADGFVNEFPAGYNTQIVQGGNNVSGGQKQRLCIARALLKKPKILILDDSTSAVDTKTDALIRKAFREEIPNTTKIIIAQRVSSIEDADQIIVLDDGKIMGVGTSEELLKTNDIYREVYESQVKGGEDDE